VVVRWSATRKRYERQGTLVEEEALQRAEAESLSDAGQREARRIRAAESRERLDARFVRDFAGAIRARYPACPTDAELAIAEHACEKYSGRVGRSSAAKDLSQEAIDLAVRAHVRHRLTRYDELLMLGRKRDEARAAVQGEVEEILLDWRESASEKSSASDEGPHTMRGQGADPEGAGRSGADGAHVAVDPRGSGGGPR
jgi:hypothetical protein